MALLRSRGQRWDGGEANLAKSRELLPIARRAANRAQPGGDRWARLTVAECALHEHLLSDDPAILANANERYAKQ